MTPFESIRYQPLGPGPRPVNENFTAQFRAIAGAPLGPRPNNMPRFATNEELAAITGLQRQSLRLWVLRGLLPKPTLFSDGRDGVRTRWPYEAVERARFVMKMKAQGHKLDAIAEMVRARWPDKSEDA